jgi:uncharacterized protein YxjI
MFDRRRYAVKEHVGMFKLHDRYDIFDADTGDRLGLAVEDVSTMKKLLRMIISKQLLPTSIHIREGEAESGPALLTIRRGVSLFRTRVDITDGNGNALGYFKSKLLSLGGGFYVYDTSDNQVAEVKGDWKSWNFKFLGAGGRELGVVAKKWGGLMKEMFTSADSYVITLADDVPTTGALAALLLAAGLAIDVVFKESKG